MIKAVVFDLYETLVTQSGVDVPRAGALGESLGLDARTYRRKWKELRPLALHVSDHRRQHRERCDDGDGSKERGAADVRRIRHLGLRVPQRT